MAKKIVKVEDKPKKNAKSKIDLDKIKDTIVDNQDTIIEVAKVLLDNKSKSSTKKKSKSKTTTKKSTKKKESSNLDTVLDIASTLLKK